MGAAGQASPSTDPPSKARPSTARPSKTGQSALPPDTRVGYLGPAGTYTEQALLGQSDLAAAVLRPYASIPDVLTALDEGSVDVGFVPIENAIEGAVNVTQDTLAFDLSLLIQREAVLDVSLDLIVRPNVGLHLVEEVVSFPVALAQCRTFLREHLPDARVQAATSTAEAARLVATEEQHARSAAIANPRAAEVYGLEALRTQIQDHPGNQTRFLLLAPSGIVAPTGHDKTSVVVFQHRNEPGSLLAILQEFAARRIDLSRLESRPTRQTLGDYCFLLDFAGHVGDEVVGDCLRQLRAKGHDVKFLGSYPAAGADADDTRRANTATLDAADGWLAALRHQIHQT